MFSSSPNPEQSPPELFYTRHSPPSNNAGITYPPIIFLHGGASCHLEFDPVVGFLSNDHECILVDLPGHSGSRAIPFTEDTAVDGIAHIITTHVKGKKAHIVGLSLGGHMGLALAQKYPELVLSLFCTGCVLGGLKRWFLSRPRLMACIEMGAGRAITESMFWYSLGVEKPIAGLRDELLRNHSMATLTGVYNACTATSLVRLAQVEDVRIAIVAGGKQDSVDGTREAGRVLKGQNPACRAFVVRRANHWWDVQFPELFAQGVRAWVDGREMPEEYEVLE
ncbi:alpha/beta-hydrolase [Tothia fuscella]|uniref:Alpha/beta-hydrolase n=1 Tax=Tothia fuscella TaxID=1048955 RepID=A0A9P4TSW0_9PEZI|nr:alpha/beta-hydrolase [Tothia fuscella]